MSFTSAYDSAILSLILAAKGITNIADNTATSPATVVWIGLHESDPGAAGNQTSGETAYTGYARVSVARSTIGWVVGAAGNASPAAAITFGTATTTSTGTITFASIGLSSSGTGTLIASGAISPSINYGLNVIPQLTTGSSFTLV